MVWRWCLITDDASILAGTSSEGSNPDPVSELPPSQVQNPRGVVVADRTQVYVTGTNPNTAQTVLATWVLNALGSNVATFLTEAGDFSSSVKDVALDSDGNVLGVDAGNNAIFRY